jgi:hypothetical protein
MSVAGPQELLRSRSAQRAGGDCGSLGEFWSIEGSQEIRRTHDVVGVLRGLRGSLFRYSGVTFTK